NGSGNQFDLRMAGENNRFRRNIVSYADPNAMLLSASGSTKTARAESDPKLYFLRAHPQPPHPGVGTFTCWEKIGFDQHSIVADPLFQDTQQEDYQLRPESPAYQLGFQPIPINKIGPRARSARHRRHD